MDTYIAWWLVLYHVSKRFQYGRFGKDAYKFRENLEELTMGFLTSRIIDFLEMIFWNFIDNLIYSIFNSNNSIYLILKFRILNSAYIRKHLQREGETERRNHNYWILPKKIIELTLFVCHVMVSLAKPPVKNVSNYAKAR